MFKLILEHEYHQPLPAVDSSRFLQHGRIIDALHSPDGRDAGSGELNFFLPSSAVRVPSGPTWQNMGSIAVQVWLKLNALPGLRQNIIEGDNCFALFVDPQGAVIASYLGLVQGQAAPQWNSVSTNLHAPGGQAVFLQPGVWTFLSFVFDGFGRARIWVDGTLAAVRADFTSGVASVGSAGVVIGNWTLANQYWLNGEIDSVRVWKEDPAAAIAQFYSRLGPAEREAWDRFFDCLAKMNPDRQQQFKALTRELDALLAMVIRGFYQAPVEQQQTFFALLEAYQQAWRSNTIGSDEHVSTVFDLYGFFEDYCGSQFATRFRQLTDDLFAIFEGEAAECLGNSGVDGQDGEYYRFIEKAAWHFGGIL